MFKGVYTALITPFKKDGSLDEDALRKLVDFQIKNGVAGLVPSGTTGESPTLSHEDHNRVIEIVVDQANGKVPVIAGTGANNTEHAIIMTKHAKEAGADASLQVAPYYNKPTQEGFFQHFTKIANDCEFPLIIYNIPGRTGKNIETSTMVRLANNPYIVAVKEASGDMAQMMDVIDQTADDFDVLSGDDNITLPLISFGGRGVISVASNIIPKQMVEMVNAALDGDFKKAMEKHYDLMPFFKAEFIETNPIPIKSMLAMKGMCEEVYRLPMCSMSDENKQKVRDVLKSMKIL